MALVVDDAQDGAKLLVRMLGVLGYEAVQAHSGTQALQLLTVHTPKVVLLDIMLPDIDGCELARRIRAMTRHDGARLYAVTGFDVISAPELFDGFMQKPITIARLKDLLEAGSTTAFTPVRGSGASLPDTR